MTPEEIIEKRKERAEALDLTICPKCGYCNQKFNVNTYGTCTCCDLILDQKAKMRYEIKRRNNIKKINK